MEPLEPPPLDPPLSWYSLLQCFYFSMVATYT